MSRVPRLLRTLHTSVPRFEATVAPGVTAVAAQAGESSSIANINSELSVTTQAGSPAKPTTPPIRFTAKGRPLYTRPPRTTRVTLPSGYPEPPAYPPPAEYLAEIEAIKTKPKPHPLWAFFHVPAAASAKPKAGAVMPDNGSLWRMNAEDVNMASGRAWTAEELRQKSFEDLHTLWYILLRERNVLVTQREERRRLTIAQSYGGELLTKRGARCSKSMARIKYVLNERRLALIAAGAKVAPVPEDVVAPTTLPMYNDPIAAVEALAGAAPPDLASLIGKRKVLPPPTRQEELFEEADEKEPLKPEPEFEGEGDKKETKKE